MAAVNELLKSHGMMKKAMKQLNKMGLGSLLGSTKAKKETLKGMSPTGDLVSDSGGGLMGGLGTLGSGLGAGMKGLGNRLMGGSGLPAGMDGDLASMMGGGGPRPMGSSATRKSGSKRKKRKKDKKDKKKRKGKR